jgi:transcriptional regulator with XRE-family HTH domain
MINVMTVTLPLGATHEDVAREVSHRIKERMNARGMKQAHLARAVGSSRDSASKWFRGKSIPRKPMLEKIARALACTVDDLLPSTVQSSNTPALSDFNLQFIGGGRCPVRMDRILPVGIGTKIADMLVALEPQQGCS